MNARLCLATALVVAGTLWLPRDAEACGCLGTYPSPATFRYSTAVFVGRIVSTTRPPVRMSSNVDTFAAAAVAPIRPPGVIVEVTRVFRGSIPQPAVLEITGTTCDFPFAPSETWLIYAIEERGVLSTHKCFRTRLVSEATEDLKYLEGLLEGRAQAVLSGDVLQRTPRAGAPALVAVSDAFEVVAAGAGQRFRAKTDRWGPYQLVLPPGQFEVWVERRGRRVTPTSTIRVRNGDEKTLCFSARLR